MKRKVLVLLIFLVVLVLDQSSKVWVKLNMAYGEEISIFGQDWALIHFVENNGMAFGMSLGGAYGKLALSLFRIIAVSLLGVYLLKMIRSKADRTLLTSFSLILAGAVGNIIDSVFYGVVFSASAFHGGTATLFPEAGGYAALLHGRVVDMLYFPITYGTYPDWVPFVGGSAYSFFSAIFNIADVAISLGVVVLLYYFFFGQQSQQHSEEE